MHPLDISFKLDRVIALNCKHNQTYISYLHLQENHIVTYTRVCKNCGYGIHTSQRFIDDKLAKKFIDQHYYDDPYAWI